MFAFRRSGDLTAGRYPAHDNIQNVLADGAPLNLRRIPYQLAFLFRAAYQVCKSSVSLHVQL
jgi:hypothetical protein